MTTKLKVKLTPHAVERYKDRLAKEHLTDEQAQKEILALMQYAVEGKPAWLSEARENAYGRKHTYVAVEDVAFPARETNSGAFILISCITKGSLSPQKREVRTKHKHIKRSRRGAGLRRLQGR
jgi:hypothetical protein